MNPPGSAAPEGAQYQAGYNDGTEATMGAVLGTEHSADYQRGWDDAQADLRENFGPNDGTDTAAKLHDVEAAQDRVPVTYDAPPRYSGGTRWCSARRGNERCLLVDEHDRQDHLFETVPDGT